MPVIIEHICTFVVDQSQLAHAHDVRADDCGVWKNNGMRPCVVTWDSKDAAIVARGAKQCKECQKMNRTYFHMEIIEK